MRRKTGTSRLHRICPAGREQVIAEHACRKYANASAKSLNEEAVRLAVVARIRHAETGYDELLSRGMERWEARNKVAGRMDDVLDRWK